MANKPNMPPMPQIRKGTLGRLFKLLFSFYPVALPLILLCILFSAVVAAIPAVFMQNVIAIIESSWQSGDWAGVSGQIFRLVGILIVLYILSMISSFTWKLQWRRQKIQQRSIA